MLHELLFALTGHTGDIFILNETKSVSIAKNLPFIHTTEEATLNKLCYLANYYLKLKTFVHETNNYFDNSIGLYARSFARGLELCMEPYQRSIIDLENELLCDPYLTFAHVVARLEEYQKVFPSLVKLSEEVAGNKVYGCAILDMLYKESICGVPSIRKAILKILRVCHSTMYKQLASWILHGMLFDDNNINKDSNKPRNEYFIKRVENNVGANYAEGDIVKKYKDDRSANCGEDFDLDIEMLPDHISLKTAQKILFIGRSVVIFESSGKGKQGSSITKNKQEEFMTSIKRLSTSETFDVICFEETIDGIRTYVAEQLWNLMVSQSDLQLQLRYFKDFFLIGRGELFLAFIDQSQDILRKPPIVMTQHDVNVAFQYAARNVSVDEEIYQRFKFVIEVPEGKTTTAIDTTTNTNVTNMTKNTTTNASLSLLKQNLPLSFLSTRESGWKCLKMVASVDWPLHVMFTPGIIKKYSQLFSFLLYIKRIQSELQHCWSIEMSRRHLSSSKINSDRFVGGVKGSPPSSLNDARRLRNHMAFLVDNLQYYLQVDVIESQYCLMLDKIKTKKDFEEIMLAHDFFLTSLHHQCFFHSKQISNCLTRILELCHACYGLMVYSDNMSSMESQLQEISKEFELQSNLLFRLLSSFRNNQSSNPHLAQLLLRIDYNKFFSSVHQL